MILQSFFYCCIFFSIIPKSFSDVYVYSHSNKLVEDYDDQLAGFGPSLSSEGLKGFVITTQPPNACKPVLSPPNVSMENVRWIALVPRTKGNDSCDFDLKVLNAQNANFSAVIVYNYENELITMGTRGRNVRIPSTMISLDDGKSLIAHYLYNRSIVNSTQPFYIKLFNDRQINIGAYLVPFAVSVGILFLAFIGFILIRCCLARRRLRRHRLPRSALKQLKTKKFVKGDRWEVCAICLDDYVEGAKLRILPCDHAYHMKCIDPWLLNSRRQCPVCKRYVFPNQENSDEENQEHQPNVQSTERTPLLHPIEPRFSTSDRRFGALQYQGFRPSLVSSDQPTDDDDDDDHQTTSTAQLLTTDSHPVSPRLTLNRNENESTVLSDVLPSPTFASARSENTLEGSSDIETIDDDEHAQENSSTIEEAESNPAFVNDEQISRTEL